MRTKLLSFGLWAVVSASLLFWGLRLAAPRPGLPAQAHLPMRHVAMGGDLGRLLGAAAPADAEEDAPSSDERYHLLGVVAPRGAGTSPQGVALISVGDQPAKAWRTGAVVDGDTVLLSVSKRSVQLGPRGGAPTIELSLPDPATANRSAPALPVARVSPPPGGVLFGAVQNRPLGLGGGVLPLRPQAGLRPEAASQPAGNDGDSDE